MTEEITYEFIPEVYIVESADIKEYYGGFQEGKALQESLKIMKIPNYYFPVFTRNGLEYALKLITPSHSFGEDKERNIARFTVPVIHISAHGADNFFRLTDGSAIGWKDLKSILVPINTKCNGCLILCMSVCRGFMAYKAAETVKSSEIPFFQLIGPKGDVLWKDSLLAFLIFYSRFDLLCHDRIGELTSIMNNSISKDLFDIIDGATVQSNYYDKILEIARRILSNRAKVNQAPSAETKTAEKH